MGRSEEGKEIAEGEAIAMWIELADAEKNDYSVAKDKLIKKMVPPVSVSLEEFQK